MSTKASATALPLDPTGLALLLVDVQAAFIEALPEGKAILQRCCFATQAAALNNLPIFVTEQLPEKLGATHPDLLQAARPTAIFAKTTFSAWQAEGLRQALAQHKVKHLLIAGLETSICIYQTVLDALKEKFSVTVLTDCIGAVRTEDSQAVWSFLQHQTHASLLPAETVFYSILGDAKHPHFSNFNRLVKAYRTG